MEQGKAVDSEGAREILNRITRRREELTRSMTEHIIDEVEEYSESETVDLAVLPGDVVNTTDRRPATEG